MLASVVAIALLAVPGAKKQSADIESRARKLLGAGESSWEAIAFSDVAVSFVQRGKVQTHDSGNREAWILTIHIPKEKTYTGKLYGSSFALVEMDCAKNRMRDLEIIFYSGYQDGDIVGRATAPDDVEWSRAVPGSVGQKQLEAVCEQPREMPSQFAEPPEPAPSLYFLEDAASSGVRSLSASCSLDGDPRFAWCTFTQTAVTLATEPRELAAKQQAIRAEARKNEHKTGQFAEICSGLKSPAARERISKLGPVAKERFKLFDDACASTSPEGWTNPEVWTEVAVAMEALATTSCRVWSFSQPPIRFERVSPGRWTATEAGGMCGHTSIMTIQSDGSSPPSYIYSERRIQGPNKTKDCVLPPEDKERVFKRRDDAHELVCREISFGP